MKFGVVFLLAAVAACAQVEMRYVDLPVSDGLKLRASYYSPGTPGPGVLLLHQCNRDRSVWNDLAMQLAASGLHVLTFDMRGYGESQGDRFREVSDEKRAAMAAHWPADIDTAWQFLASQTGVDKANTGVGGASCGVNNAIQTARRHPEVKTLVLLSGDTDGDGVTFLAGAKTLPVFIAASENDGDTLARMRWIFAFSNDARSKLLSFKAAGHGADMFRVETTLPGTIVSWFDQMLLNPQPPGEPKKVSPEEEFWTQLTAPKGVPSLRKTLEKARRKNRSAPPPFPEYPVNLYGYDLLRKGDTRQAIAVLKLNELGYPKSANVYDSLADAYLADHQEALALQYSEKCLKVLTENPPADAERAAEIRGNTEARMKKLKH